MEMRVCYLTDVTHDLQVQELLGCFGLHLWFLNQQIFLWLYFKTIGRLIVSLELLFVWLYESGLQKQPILAIKKEPGVFRFATDSETPPHFLLIKQLV